MSDEDAKIDAEVAAAPDPLQAILARLEAIESQNKALQKQNEDLQRAMAETAEQSHIMTGDSAKSGLRMDVARSVTVPTRPVRENPEQYNNVINLNDVSQRGGN